MAAEGQHPQVRPASTVVVLRDAASAPEILMLRRHEQISREWQEAVS